ncbi:helix-turn-helix domain-containing protein [Psychroserpens sp. Hel_I_66]|uniref:helix-turn-helix domain-containing protein n=1 Tax=Psychroserpens sp. Hel_I_66 TaxID=1250004 RepID=UPI0006487D41|nr:helix-turn-helix domain-containing protein [Psychroserpens sp. Hel_I_66]
MESKPLYVYPFNVEGLTDSFSNRLDIKFKEFANKFSPKKDEEELLTVEETIAFLKCSKQALWNWRKNGILPSYRLGNRVYYRKSDIFAKLIKQE